MEYDKFLQSKQKVILDTGFTVEDSELNSNLFDFQKYIVRRALKKGKYAIFAERGLGKTLLQLSIAEYLSKKQNKTVLILAPLAVRLQTIQEAKKFNIDIEKFNKEKTVKGNIYITNYEQLNNIIASDFDCLILDESSILKNFTGAYKRQLIENFERTPYKFCFSATPSPNDELEIGNHAEHLNVCKSIDMRSDYFTTDKSIKSGNKYRLKKHAEDAFYKWLCSWAIMIKSPNDIGFDGSKYQLPDLNYKEYKLVTPKIDNGQLFNDASCSATNFNTALKDTLDTRLNKVADIVNTDSGNQYLIWIKQNIEGDILKELIPGSVNVEGSMKPDEKEKYLLGFANNEFRVLITKTKIAQFGLNYQNCFNQIFAAPDFSFEGVYQAIGRSYRFGQTKEVNIHLIVTDTMENVINSLKEKEAKFKHMQSKMIKYVNYNYRSELKMNNELRTVKGQNYELINGDCIKAIKEMADNSIDYSFFSPPFGALYTFSSDLEDLSNCKDDDEFFDHFKFLIPELKRVIKPGRLISMHIMQGTTLINKEGFLSIKDFRGDLIRLFQANGFYFHAENMIRKDPKTAAIRTKNRQLMWGTTKKDSSIVRPGLADYIITFRVPGENKEPVRNDIPFDKWCKIAEPIWLDVNESNTLNTKEGKAEKDEKHITATQLDAIENCYLMWTNPNDLVFSPFTGIGSEGYQALKMNRRFIGTELKESYFDLACKNLERAINEGKQLNLMDLIDNDAELKKYIDVKSVEVEV